MPLNNFAISTKRSCRFNRRRFVDGCVPCLGSRFIPRNWRCCWRCWFGVCPVIVSCSTWTASTHLSRFSLSPIAYFRTSRRSLVVSSTRTFGSSTPTAFMIAMASEASHRPILCRAMSSALSRKMALARPSLKSSLSTSTSSLSIVVVDAVVDPSESAPAPANFLVCPRLTIRWIKSASTVPSDFSSLAWRFNILETELWLTTSSFARRRRRQNSARHTDWLLCCSISTPFWRLETEWYDTWLSATTRKSFSLPQNSSFLLFQLLAVSWCYVRCRSLRSSSSLLSVSSSWRWRRR